MSLLSLTNPSRGGSSSASSYLGQVATRCFPPNNDNGASVTYGMSQGAHYLRDKVSNQLVMEFPHYSNKNAAEADRGATAGTLKASIRLPDNTWLLADQIAQNSGAAVAFPAGNTKLTWTLNNPLPDGFCLLERAYQYNAAGIFWTIVAGGNVYGNHPLDFMDIGGGTGTDKTTSGATIGAANGIGFFPVVIAGMTTKPGVLINGTSREAGGVGVTGDPLTDLGPSARSIGKRLGYCSFALSGSYLSQWNAGSHAYFNALLAKGYFTHLINEQGVNDIAVDATAAVTAARRALFAANVKVVAPNIVIIGHTLTHNMLTGSSDQFVSKAGQSQTSPNTKILTFNDLVRAGIAGENMVWDTFDALDPYRTGVLPVTLDILAPSYTPAVFTGAISGTTLTVSALTSGPALSPGDSIMDPTSTDGSVVVYNTVILRQLTGTAGGVGTYLVSKVHDGSFPRNAAVSSRTLSTAGRITRDGLHLCFLGEDIIAQRKGGELLGVIRL